MNRVTFEGDAPPDSYRGARPKKNRYSYGGGPTSGLGHINMTGNSGIGGNSSLISKSFVKNSYCKDHLANYFIIETASTLAQLYGDCIAENN